MPAPAAVLDDAPLADAVPRQQPHQARRRALGNTAEPGVVDVGKVAAVQGHRPRDWLVLFLSRKGAEDVVTSGREMNAMPDTDKRGYPYKTHLNVLHDALQIVDIPALVEACTDEWYNQTLTRVNDSVVRLGVLKGEYHWHKHEDEDEFFFLVKGRFIVDLEDRSVELAPSQGITNPARRGAPHTRARALDCVDDGGSGGDTDGRLSTVAARGSHHSTAPLAYQTLSTLA